MSLSLLVGLLIFQVVGYLSIRWLKMPFFKTPFTLLCCVGVVLALPTIFNQMYMPTDMPCGNPMIGPYFAFTIFGLPWVIMAYYFEEMIFKATPIDPEQSQNLPEKPQ